MKHAGVRRLLLPLFLLTVAFSNCDEKVKPAAMQINSAYELPDQESWNSSVTFSDSGMVRAILTATHIRMYEARRETFLDSGLTVDFYANTGAHASKLSSRRGRVDDATGNLEAFDDVLFVSDSGTVVRTDYLFWDQGQRKVRSDRFVTVTSPKEKLQGYGFEADQNLRNYVIYRVSGEAEIVEEK